jgi:hypothetical protein
MRACSHQSLKLLVPQSQDGILNGCGYKTINDGTLYKSIICIHRHKQAIGVIQFSHRQHHFRIGGEGGSRRLTLRGNYCTNGRGSGDPPEQGAPGQRPRSGRQLSKDLTDQHYWTRQLNILRWKLSKRSAPGIQECDLG